MQKLKILKNIQKRSFELVKNRLKASFFVKKTRNYAFSTKSAKNSKILGKCGEKWGDMVDLNQ